jgi:uroporphyrinogen-III synthase
VTDSSTAGPALKGLRVLLLRPKHQVADLSERLAAAGAEPIAVPAVEIVAPRDWAPVDDALDRLSEFDWIVFTSVNGVAGIFERLHARGRGAPLGPRVAAIGPKTARALQDEGQPVDWLPSSYTSEAVSNELPGPARVLLIRAEVAPTELEEVLRRRGFEAERVDAYGTEATNAAALSEVVKTVDAIAFTSAWIARCFVEACGAEAITAITPRVRIFSIGPATSKSLNQLGLKVDAEATEHTIPGLVSAIEGAASTRQR